MSEKLEFPLPARAIIHEQKLEIERLRAALRDLLADIADYERVNNLAPNPGKQDCWQSVTRARAALGQKENPETTSPFPEFEDSMPGLAESIRKDKE